MVNIANLSRPRYNYNNISCFLTEGGWHLRKTNWCGEADKVLDDPDLTLDASLISDGDHILLEPGRLPPKVP